MSHNLKACQNAIQTLYTSVAESLNNTASKATALRLASELSNLLDADLSTEEKLKQFEALVDSVQDFTPIAEYAFDLFVLSSMSIEYENFEEYLESEEWLALEDHLAERGTEWFSLLLYIDECINSEIEPSLEDFLEEYLLVSDELYQDEMFIYEPIIRNASLVGAELTDLERVASSIEEDDIKELFVPLMHYFSYADDLQLGAQKIQNARFNATLSKALFLATKAYHTGLLQSIQ